MSKSLNKVQLIGNVGAEPEVRTTNGGTRVATVSLATSRQWTDAKGEKQEATAWHRVILWNTKSGTGLADIAEKYVAKGDRVFVEGEIVYRSWDDAEGTTRYSTEIVARDLILLSPAKDATAKPAKGKSARGAAPDAPPPF